MGTSRAGACPPFDDTLAQTASRYGRWKVPCGVFIINPLKMKYMLRRVTVKAWNKALVFKNDRFVRILDEGKHWLFPGETIAHFDMSQPFTADNLDLLLSESAIADALDVITVGQTERYLQFDKKAFQRMLTTGRYAYWKGMHQYTYQVADITKPFLPDIDLDVLLQEETIAAALDVVTVGQSELYIQYYNNIFHRALVAGRYAFWKGIHAYEYQVADISKIWITEPLPRAVLAIVQMTAHVRQITIESYEKALLYVEGKFEKELEPGQYHFWRTPETITVYKQDMRQVQLDINGQEILTRDKASLRINCTLQYKVTDLFKAVANKEFDRQLYVIVQFALRELVTAYTLDELLEKRDGLAPQVLSTVKARAAALGVEVMDCGIRDVILPGDVKEIMNQVLLAEKKAQANIITRREETASTRSLLNTAKLMEENEMLFKLKEMEYVEKISDKITNLSVTGGGDLVAQLRQLFVPRGK